MEFTVDQALQQGVAAHREGKLEEAERLYRAILQSQTKHPDASYNLGILAVSLNKAEAALPLFKTALEANPKIEQFWLSYIDALIKENQFEDAKRALKEASKNGLAESALNVLSQQLTSEIKNPTLAQEELNRLLEHYQNGRYGDAEKLAVSITKQFPQHQLSWKVLGAVLKQTGRISESLVANQKAVELAPEDAEAHSNLGVTLQALGKLEGAEASYRQAIELKPDFTAAHYNLGNTLKELGRLEKAEASYRQAIAIKLDYPEAHYNSGNTLQELGRLEEAEASYRQAIAIKLDYAEAHSNLGNTLQELGRLEEAEASYRQAIAIKLDYAEAHSNLGNTLQELGRLEEAEASCRKALELKPDYAEAHSNLGVIFYLNGDIETALESFEKANDIEPKLKSNQLFLTVLQARKAREKIEVSSDNIRKPGCGIGLTSNPLILNRAVEVELITSLYEMNSRELDETPDTRYGNGRCSADYSMFEDDRSVIKTVASDLISIIKLAVKSDVFVMDSFFNIFGAGGGITPHAHLTEWETDNGISFASQKYSLIYYLSVGDQNCSEPGILKLYDPSEDILPCEGMIVIIPADRQHSAVYGGGKDRVMIGINFYSL